MGVLALLALILLLGFCIYIQGARNLVVDGQHMRTTLFWALLPVGSAAFQQAETPFYQEQQADWLSLRLVGEQGSLVVFLGIPPWRFNAQDILTESMLALPAEAN